MLSMATSPYRSWVEVSRQQIADNYRAIQRVVGDAIAIMPVVKADGYRHGAVEVARVLCGEGAHWLAVSNVEEGVALRDAGIRSRILVMADFLPVGRVAMLEHGLTPVLHSLEDIAELEALARTRGERVPYHLKIDSGMCRLGTRCCAADIAAAVVQHRATHFEGLMTHFASVTDFTSDQTEIQTAQFEKLRSELYDLGVTAPYTHLSSTGAIAYRRRGAWGNMVRPGHAIYGYVSPVRGIAPGNCLDVHPALTWKAAVLTVKEIPEGAHVGYGGMFQAPRPMRIAVLAVGYADGLPHRLGNRGRVIACGRFARILGAVSMDVTTIDATECPRLRVGDAVTLLGQEGTAQIDAQEIARQAGTISYSVLCAISSRVRRVYL
jgi:alanine racemase